MKLHKFKGRALYSIWESYIIEVDAIRMFSVMKNALKTGLISEQFKERLMLAVTNVNGCSLCSYAHTKYALESGMSPSEINNLLSSDPDMKEDFIAEDEVVAITFAQHYADTRCKPVEKVWHNIIEYYGEEKAIAILSILRIISMGNTLGARLSGIIDRLKGRQYDERTSIVGSVLFLIGSVITLPFVITQALIMNLLKVRYI